jgi:hypothetical protein
LKRPWLGPWNKFLADLHALSGRLQLGIKTAIRDRHHRGCPDFAASSPLDSPPRIAYSRFGLILTRRELARKRQGEPEATMKLSTDQDSLTVEALVAAIARSPIVVPRPATLLPAGFEEVDVAILNWIAAEARRMRRMVVLM